MNKTSPDDVLIRGIRDSDEEAFRILFLRLHPVVFRFLLARSGDPDLSKDISQEAFLRIWLRRTTLSPSQNILALLFRIAGNLARDHFRHQEVIARTRNEVVATVGNSDDQAEHDVDASILEEAVMRGINTDLSPRCREVFLLSRMEGMSNREVAEALGLSMRTVEHQINRALRILRRKANRLLSGD